MKLGAFSWTSGFGAAFEPDPDDMDDFNELQEDIEEEEYHQLGTPTTSVDLNYWNNFRNESSRELTPVNTHLVRKSPFTSHSKTMRRRSERRLLKAAEKKRYNVLQREGNILRHEQPMEALFKFREALSIVQVGRTKREKQVTRRLRQKIQKVEESINPGPSPQKKRRLIGLEAPRGNKRKKQDMEETQKKEPFSALKANKQEDATGDETQDRKRKKKGSVGAIKSAFKLFCDSKRSRYENAEYDAHQILKILQKLWRNMSADKREKYEAKAEQLRRKAQPLYTT